MCDSGLSISSIQRRRLFAGFVAARRTMMQNWCAPHVCGEAYWIAYYYYYYFISIFFSNIHDYIKEGLVLLLLFPSLSLSPLIGPLKYGVCVCCFVLFVLSGCYVVMLCVKRNKKMLITKKIMSFQSMLLCPSPVFLYFHPVLTHCITQLQGCQIGCKSA